MQKKNIFITTLEIIKVKHTKAFSNRFYEEHPNKSNLFGLSKMLSDYGVPNTGIIINNKSDSIIALEAPFIAQISANLVIVTKINNDSIDINWDSKKVTLPKKEFVQLWSGISLFMHPNSESTEPNYQQNKTIDRYNFIKKCIAYIFGSGLIICLSLTSRVFSNWGTLLLLLVNLLGLYIGLILVQKKMNIESKYVDKICSVFLKSDCNNVLYSKAANLWGVVSWAEIGLSYFISNIIILLLTPKLTPYLAIINILSLVFSFWSIWYQKYIAKHWCSLCLTVQLILWIIFILNIQFNFIIIPYTSINDLIQLLLAYMTPFLLINLLLGKITTTQKLSSITQEMSSIKATDEVFIALLKSQPHFKIDKMTSKIIFGNADSNVLISVLTNPHCEPCGEMHSRIEAILERSKGKFCIQYIFSSFEKQLDISNKFLISVFLNNEIKNAQKIYKEWFKTGKFQRNDFYKKYDFSKHSQAVEDEFNKHENWRRITNITETPTILVNGYKLPTNYKIEDLLLLEFDLNTN